MYIYIYLCVFGRVCQAVRGRGCTHGNIIYRNVVDWTPYYVWLFSVFRFITIQAIVNIYILLSSKCSPVYLDKVTLLCTIRISMPKTNTHHFNAGASGAVWHSWRHHWLTPTNRVSRQGYCWQRAHVYIHIYIFTRWVHWKCKFSPLIHRLNLTFTRWPRCLN